MIYRLQTLARVASRRRWSFLAILFIAVGVAILISFRQAGVRASVVLRVPKETRDDVVPIALSGIAGVESFHVDVDLNHDGKFEGPGELGYAKGAATDDGAGTARLHGLIHGVYQVRARFTPANGVETVSSTETVWVMPPLNRIPAAFEPNKGQADDKVMFLGRVENQMVQITATETLLFHVLPAPPQRMPKATGDEVWHEQRKPRDVELQRFRLVGASANAVPEGRKKLPGVSNYFIGNKPEKWRTDVPHFEEVVTRGVYPGIDLVYHSSQGRLEYDFHVSPGADPSAIVLGFPDVARLEIDADGGLILHKPASSKSELRTLRKSAPVMYQQRGDRLEAVKGDWALIGAKQARYVIAHYDSTRELVIDPILFSTYLAGAGFDNICAAKTDAAGNVYVAGSTTSANFPTVTPFSGTLKGGQDVFVTKINAAGTAIVYSTYLGGSGSDGPGDGLGIGVNAANEVVITSETSSNDFPTTPGCFQAAIVFFNDAFVTKLNAAGNGLVFSTYLGGGGFDCGRGADFDAAGNVYVVGSTSAGTFPTTAGAAQTVFGGGGLKGDAYVCKFSPAGARQYCTLLGGSADEEGQAIAVLGNNAYVAGITASNNFPVTASAFQKVFGGGGQDLFVAQLNAAGSAFTYATYVGGSGLDGKAILSFGAPMGLAVDAAGNAYFASGSNSPNYPVTPGVVQSTLGGTSNGVVSVLNPAGTALVWSTYLGGTGTDIFYALKLDASNNVYVTGDTSSANYPQVNSLQAYIGPFANVAISQLNSTGTALGFSTPLGKGIDTGRGIGFDGAGNIWVAGQTVTGASSFPVVNPLYPVTFGFHSFVAKVTGGAGPAPPPPPPAGPGSPSPSSEGDYFRCNGPNGDEGTFGFGAGMRDSRQTAGAAGPILQGPLTVGGMSCVLNVAYREPLASPSSFPSAPLLVMLMFGAIGSLIAWKMGGGSQ